MMIVIRANDTKQGEKSIKDSVMDKQVLELEAWDDEDKGSQVAGRQGSKLS